MIRTRLKDNKTIFYESSTGQTITTIDAVTISVVPDAVVTVVRKEGVPYIYLPHRDMALVTLKDAVEKMGLEIEVVGK